MRALRLIAAFLALALSPQIWPAWAASTGAFSIVCGSAPAGSDVSCTVSRTSGGKGVYVLIQTSDGTAKAGTDYTAVSQLLYFKASAVAQTVAVHTTVNPEATGTLTFTASIAAGTVVARTTGSIVEPAATPAPAPAPAPSPVPAPAPSSWVSAPMVKGGYIRCKAVGGCHGGYNGAGVVAAYGTVLQGVITDGWAMDGSMVIAAWPIGQVGVPYAGIESPASEWEGVAPS